MTESLIKQIRIMISSTRADLFQYREEASRVIAKVAAEKEKRVQLIDVSMEKETQSGNREFAVAVSKRWVEESDWIVVIVGWNYGTISDEPGADGLSVTEWEFRHASGLGKQLFVFIAGEPDTANEYRVTAEEKKDLKNWWNSKQTPGQVKKLKKFRDELGKCHAEMFANLQVFRERLEKTLKNKIDDLLPDIQPGTPLAELVITVLPNSRHCIQRVDLIADCKRIHDYLHELRQHVVRPLREEVLPNWKKEGTLSASRERVILRCMNRQSEAAGGMRAVRSAIDPNHPQLLNSIDAVLQEPALWNIEPDSPPSQPSIKAFTEVVDNFAFKVQEAFSEADRSMTREESELRECYLTLLEDLKQARQQSKLSPPDQQRLDDELEKIDTNRERVKNSLISHHSWQEAHDKLDEMDSFCERGDSFERKLNYYRGTPLEKLLSLVNQELEQTEAHQTGNGSTEHSADADDAQQAPPLTPNLQLARDAFVADLRRIKELLESLRQGAGADNFDKMRKPFDDAFYYVDKRTLSEVQQAQKRAAKLGDWLGDLAAAQKKIN